MKKVPLLVLGAALVLGGAVFFFQRPAAPPKDVTTVQTVASMSREQLLAALKTAPDGPTKRRIVQRLGTGPEVLATMKQVWSGFPGDDEVQDEVILVTERLGSVEAVRWLAELAGKEEGLAARAGAALGRQEGAVAAPVLAEVAVSNAPVLSRANAVLALATSGGREHAGLLAALVGDKAQPQRVRQEAALALGKLGGPEQVPTLASVLEETAGVGTQEAEQLRISVIQGLGGIRAPEAQGALRRYAAREVSAAERAFLTEALAQQQP
jgi:hypothetical protein